MQSRRYLWGIKYCPAMSQQLGHFSSFWRPCYHLKIFHMITFLNILISPSSIPKNDLVLSHNSSCDDPISTSPVPKSHIVISHYSSWRDLKLTSPVPKNYLDQVWNLSCYDHESIPLSQKVTLFCPIFHLAMIQYQCFLSQKVTLFCPIIPLIMTQYQFLLSQEVTMFVP